jgi:8-oxo-dGTP pyrophosphatase MutT (NUDIX family)
VKPLLDFEAEGAEASEPRPAATVVLLRDGAEGLEVFCVERSGKSSFLAGAIVFPGGQLDPGDREWSLAVPPMQGRVREWDRPDLRAEAFALAAVRETLEEAGILLAHGTHVAADAMRSALLAGGALRELLESAGLTPALDTLHPFSRWITPTAEKKRFDTMFFLAKAPADQPGAHDDAETVASMWASPAALLQRWERGEIAMVPPTHATLEWLAECTNVDEALRRSLSVSLAPICPELASHEGVAALLLPGDPEHSVRELLHPHALRYVLHEGRFVPHR